MHARRRSRRLLSPLAFVSLLAGVGGWGVAADWPTYQNGNDRVGATAERLEGAPRLSWTYASPAPPELAWEGPRSEPIEGKLMRHRVDFDRALPVVVAKGKAYLGSSVDDCLYCRDLATGKRLWRHPTEGAIRLAPTVADGRVYFGSDDGLVRCLDADSGALLWQIRAGPRDERLLARGRMISRWPVRTGVLIDDGIAYFGAGVFPHEQVFLVAADAATGEIRWRNGHLSQEDAGRNPLSPQGYLLASEDQLFVPSGRALPAAFNKRTGEEEFQKTHSWRTTAGGVVGGWKALLADGQLYSAGEHHFLALDQKSGAVGYGYLQGYQLTLSDDRGFIADGQRVAAVDRAKHIVATRQRQKLTLEQYNLQRQRSSLKPEEFRRRNDELTDQISQASKVGELWTTPTQLASSLILAGDLVVAGGVGQVAAFRAADGQLAWQAEVAGDASNLAAADGRLLVSTDQGRVYCFAFGGAVAADARYPDPESLADSPFPRDEWTPKYEAAASAILKRTGQQRGFCLVLGSEEGRLAYELAKQSQLRIYGIEPDAAKAAASSEALAEAGLLGRRVVIVHAPLDGHPLSNYFANLIVSDTLLRHGEAPWKTNHWAQCLKPIGGVACLGAPGLEAPQLRALVSDTGVAAGPIQVADSLATMARGPLPGAGRWSHQYGDPSNTMTSKDYRVKGGLGVLWYGDPGPSKMINRHDAAAAPLSTNGRMFVQGVSNIMCYDAYNGLFLWEYENPQALRTGVFNNEEPSNLAASDDALFVAVDDTCTELDAATGKVRRVHRIPPSTDKLPRAWGFVAEQDGALYGTSTVRTELEKALRRRGHTVKNATDAIFAIDRETGRQKWIYRGRNILHVTIALSEGRVFFIDSTITKEERDALLRQDKTALQNLGPEEAKKKEEELKKLDVRLAVALDAETGKQLWSKPVDVTDCSRVGIGGGELTLMAHDGHVLICGANANGHYWRQFLSGQFDQRRLVVLDAATGKKLWSHDANYRHRPIIVEDQIIAEPWSFALHTGVQKMRENPLTGEQTPWQFSRPGHHCGPITATPNMLFFRSGFTGYYDLYGDSGTSHFAGHRLGCWVNAIPGNGLLMIPEASAGCVCQFSIASTIVMEPREDRDSWRIYSATGDKTPIREACLNFGAPGDRKDQLGRMWLSIPRPNLVGRLEFDLQAAPKLHPEGTFALTDEQSHKIEGVESPWLYTSAADGLKSVELLLLGKDDQPAHYQVSLHLITWKDGDGPVDIKLQGETVARDVSVGVEAGGADKALVKTFRNVAVTGSLLIEMTAPQQGTSPLVAAIHIKREE